MMRLYHCLGSLASFLFLSDVVLGASTCNTATNRACWTSDFNIATDYEAKWPVTGVTRTYTLNVVEIDNWVGGDGRIKEKAMLFNGQFPGPILKADWGDRINITVVNQLRVNGTSIHWHGLRQLNNNIADGANGVTECPIPPGHNKTYSFLAAQYGTSWYHSHFSSQYANGMTGSIVINGPASLPYEIDLGVFPVSDWYYGTADNIQARVTDPNNPFVPGAPGAPPPSDNVLINGSNIDPAGGPGGKYTKVTLTPGKRHLLRLINPSVENTFVVSLTGHQFTVIATDFIPINSYTTKSIFMGLGQRYDVTIDGSAPVGNYWFNVTFSNTLVCGSSNNPAPAAIFTYPGAPDSLPTDTSFQPTETFCQDDVHYYPVVQRSINLTSFAPQPDNSLPVTFEVDGAASRVFWKVNGSAIDVAWEKPTLQYVRDGQVATMPRQTNVITLPDANKWTFWVITNVSPIPHPMHLHGHDFLLVGRAEPLTFPLAPTNGPRFFNFPDDLRNLTAVNPPRRDTTMLPAFGWLVVAFETDNPGAWLFHCHISWHVSQGLSVQFLERPGEIPGAMDLGALQPNCGDWSDYYATSPYKKTDSGL